MNIIRTVTLGTAALVLAGCGLIPLPEIPLGDISTPVPPLIDPAETVVYVDRNVFEGTPSSAGFTSGAKITGDGTYSGADGIRQFDVFLSKARPECDDQTLPGYILCSGPATGIAVGTAEVANDTSRSVTLSGVVIDEAVEAKSGYIGIKFSAGPTTGLNDVLKFTNLKASARL